MALDYYLADKTKIILVGALHDGDTQALSQVVQNYFLLNAVVNFYDSSKELQDEYKAMDGKATAYICKNFACLPPVTNTEMFANMLKG